MKITKEQEKLLNSFVCQRLSADPGNRKLVKTFRCRRNPQLAAYLQFRGWDEDSSGATTFYVIKDEQNRILLYFSLKCGSLFDPLNLEELKQQVETYKKALDAIRKRRRGTAEAEELALIEQMVQDFGMNIGQLEWDLRQYIMDIDQKIAEVKADRRTEPNKNIAQVVRTYPAVELVHFCVNDEARDIWPKLAKKYHIGSSHTMAQVLFWRFVAPIIGGIHQTLGCQYVYLFAADDSLDRRLINYYQVALNFSQDGNITTSKPRYDFTCEFMYQKIEDLRDFREYYFDNFNPKAKEVIV